MIKRYSFEDPIFKSNTKHPNLRINANNNPILNVYRLISGTLNCLDEYTNIKYKFRYDLLSFPSIINTKVKYETISNNFPEEVQLEDLNNYFKLAKANIGFYKNIQDELIKCFIAEKKQRHLEAFFYLYRVIEGISYSIPLIYVSKSKNYNKSYRQLKSFFGKEKEGELAFFKRYISTIYKDEEFYKSTIDIDFNQIEIEELREKYFNIYLTKMKDSNIIDKTEFEEIKITFLGFYEFLLNLRNRFFHFHQGTWQENLSTTEIMFPDFFFKPIIIHALNWISIIIFEIIKVDFSKELNH